MKGGETFNRAREQHNYFWWGSSGPAAFLCPFINHHSLSHHHPPQLALFNRVHGGAGALARQTLRHYTLYLWGMVQYAHWLNENMELESMEIKKHCKTVSDKWGEMDCQVGQSSGAEPSFSSTSPASLCREAAGEIRLNAFTQQFSQRSQLNTTIGHLNLIIALTHSVFPTQMNTELCFLTGNLMWDPPDSLHNCKWIQFYSQQECDLTAAPNTARLTQATKLCKSIKSLLPAPKTQKKLNKNKFRSSHINII